MNDKLYKIFTIIENEFLYDIETEGTVISTGGSAVYCEEGMESLKENGIVVYIKLPYKEIEKRIYGESPDEITKEYLTKRDNAGISYDECKFEQCIDFIK